MTARKRDTKGNWIDPDDAPEWPDEVWDRAQISVGVRRPERLPSAGAPSRLRSKQQVTLRLPKQVIEHFKASGAGWLTRIGEVLERHAQKAKRKSA